MVTCTFCGENFQNKGTMFVLKSGKILYFCSAKCYKNHSLGRKGKNIKWTKIAEHLKKTGISAKDNSEDKDKE